MELMTTKRKGGSRAVPPRAHVLQSIFEKNQENLGQSYSSIARVFRALVVLLYSIIGRLR